LRKSSRTSTKLVPLNGSPPIPTQVDCAGKDGRERRDVTKITLTRGHD
jgi:hypothetical protein